MNALRRIGAMFLRYLYLHRHSLPRTLEIFFWPVMELLVWGYVALYLADLGGTQMGRWTLYLVNAMIFWDILYRCQQSLSVSLLEEIWTQNITNLFVSPLKAWEWVASIMLYGVAKISLITLLLGILSYFLFQFGLLSALSFYLIPFMLNLLLFGWAVGMITAGLLVRWGHAAEALAWGIPFLIQPLSAVYYPVSSLPPLMQGLSRLFPSTYVFEGMRTVIQTGHLNPGQLWASFTMNALALLGAAFWLRHELAFARRSGKLARLGTD